MSTLEQTLMRAAFTSSSPISLREVLQLRSALKAPGKDALLAEIESLLIDAAPYKGVTLTSESVEGSPGVQAINWGNVLAFVQTMLPLILQLIAVFTPPKPAPVTTTTPAA